ncbi:Transcriptional regulatory protein CssR [compost metagenome]
MLWNHQEVDLTMKEFELLHVFALHPNRAFTREELLMLVWGEDYFGSDRAVDHLIKRVRKKITELPIEAVWGHGYRLRINEEAGQLEAGIPD